MADKQIRIDGSVDTPPAAGPVLERNADGSLPDIAWKALRWYMIEHELKPYTLNAWPLFRFQDRKGKDVKVNINDISQEYDGFKKRNHGKRQSAA
jgi:hypothetical protein